PAAPRGLRPAARRAAKGRDAARARDAARDREPLARTTAPPLLSEFTDLVLTAGVRADPFARPSGGVCACDGRAGPPSWRWSRYRSASPWRRGRRPAPVRPAPAVPQPPQPVPTPRP